MASDTAAPAPPDAEHARAAVAVLPAAYRDGGQLPARVVRQYDVDQHRRLVEQGRVAMKDLACRTQPVATAQRVMQVAALRYETAGFEQ